VFDFEGRDAYNDYREGSSPTRSQEHPFFRQGGVKKPTRPPEIEALVVPVAGTISDVSLRSPVLVQFKLTGHSGSVTMENAQTSFDVKVDGKPAGFHFWTYSETKAPAAVAPSRRGRQIRAGASNVTGGYATVTLRFDWPLPDDAKVEIALRQPKSAN
jgi:hypothetical protein